MRFLPPLCLLLALASPAFARQPLACPSKPDAALNTKVTELLAEHRVIVHALCITPINAEIDADFAVDPQTGPNESFYHELYGNLIALLPRRDILFHDASDDILIRLTKTGPDSFKIDYEPQ